MTLSRDSLEKLIRVKEEILKREAQKGIFRSFVAYMNSDYMFNWHHRLIADKLQKFLKDPDSKRLIISVPPQHGKTELTTRNFSAYALGERPDLNIALCSYAHDLASGFNRDVQRIIDTDRYKKIYPETTINSKNVVTTQSWLRNAEEFEVVNKKGKLKAVGVGGGLTGKPVDLGIIDDPIKDYKEAYSSTVRESIWNWYVSVFLTRLHNNSKQIIIATRWHPDDLIGRLLKLMSDNPEDPQNQWDVLNIPAILEKKTDYDPREIGDALWPNRHSAEKIMNIKKLQSLVFDALYQGNPVPDGGNKVKETDFEWADRLPDLVEGPFIFIDGAYTKKTENDPTGIMEVYFDRMFDKLYVARALTKRQELPELLETLKSMENTINRQPESLYYIEPKASGKSIGQMINARPGAIPAVEIQSYLVSEDKEARLQLAATYIKAKKFILLRNPENHVVVSQLCSFPAGEDEMVDLAGYACDIFFEPESRGDRWTPLGLDHII